MSSSVTAPGISNLIQTLTAINPSLMSTPGVTAALEKASPSDIVQLSDSALELQNVQSLFGDPTASITNNALDLTSLSTSPDVSQLSQVATLFGSANTTVSSTAANSLGLTQAQLASYLAPATADSLLSTTSQVG